MKTALVLGGVAGAAFLGPFTQTVYAPSRGTAVGAYNFFRFLGATIGPIVGAFIAARFSVQAVILSVAALLLVSALLLQVSLYDPFEDKA